MFWEGNKVDVVPINTNPFSANITMVESIFYSPCVGPIMLTNDYEEGSMEFYNLTSQGFKWSIQSIQANSQFMIQLIGES